MSDVIDVGGISKEPDLDSMKQELLALAASTCRGECTGSVEQTEQIVGLIEKLELANTAASPAIDERVYGTWDLVYS